MKRPLIALAVLLAAISGADVLAQSAPVRGVGLLALNASDAHSDAGNGPGGRSTRVEIPDGGGGGFGGAHASRGGGDLGAGTRSSRDSDEATPADPPAKAAIAPGDPGAPAAATPKRPNYRWQSLVPGAIK
jgi:hypothetical protein